MQYLRIKNYDQYQHYKDRNPPWIKLYRCILNDYELRSVPIPSRLAYIYLLIIASETDNRIPNDYNFLSQRFGFEVNELIITPLIHSGFLLASGARRLLACHATSSSLLSLNLNSLNPDLKTPDLKSKKHSTPKRVLRSICDDDAPTEKHRGLAAQLQIDIGPEWAKFKNYCLAHDKRYANFEAAFRNWLANANDMKGAKRA